jgi:hypothetical protein
MRKTTEAQIDEIVATCEGDLHGALRALMLVNEHLESELEQLRASCSCDQKPEQRVGSLH